MEKYKIEIKRSAAKELERLPAKDLRQILDRIESLASNPRPKYSKKLSNEEKYRIRYGNYRILYLIEELVLVVYIVKVGHRRDVYR